jgi:serine/threonine protein kinase
LANKVNFKFNNTKPQKLKNIIPRASDLALNLLENILCLNPIKRLSASQCLQHPFFQCYDILSIYGLKLNSGISNSVLYNFSKSNTDNSNANINNANLNNNIQKKNSSNNTNNNNIFSNTIEKRKKSNMNNINK